MLWLLQQCLFCAMSVVQPYNKFPVPCFIHELFKLACKAFSNSGQLARMTHISFHLQMSLSSSFHRSSSLQASYRRVQLNLLYLVLCKLAIYNTIWHEDFSIEPGRNIQRATCLRSTEEDQTLLMSSALADVDGMSASSSRVKALQEVAVIEPPLSSHSNVRTSTLSPMTSSQHPLAAPLEIYGFRKVLFRHLCAFDLASLVSVFRLHLSNYEKQRYLNFARDIFTDDELEHIRELRSARRHLILFGNDIPHLKNRLLYPHLYHTRHRRKPLQVWLACKAEGITTSSPPSLVQAGGIWGAWVSTCDTELPWADDWKVWQIQPSQHCPQNAARSYGMKMNCPSPSVQVNGKVTWMNLHHPAPASQKCEIWMDRHASYAMLTGTEDDLSPENHKAYTGFNGPYWPNGYAYPFALYTWLNCTKERPSILEKTEELPLHAWQQGLEVPIENPPVLDYYMACSPRILHHIDLCSENPTLTVSRMKPEAGDVVSVFSNVPDQHEKLEINLYTDNPPTPMAWNYGMPPSFTIYLESVGDFTSGAILMQ